MENSETSIMPKDAARPFARVVATEFTQISPDNGSADQRGCFMSTGTSLTVKADSWDTDSGG